MANRYFQSKPQEYISSFVPLPLDFLEREMGRRQQRFDTGVQSMAQAQDQFGGIEVSQADIKDKAELIDKYFGDIQKEVQDKFGGDYGQAVNLIARRIGAFNQNPTMGAFSQRLQEENRFRDISARLAAQGKLVTRGDDPFSRPTLDPETGQLSTPDFASDILSRNDYGKYLDSSMVRKLSNNISQGALRNSQGNPGMLESEIRKGTNPNSIAGHVTDDVVADFMANNPTWTVEHGQDPEAARQFITQHLMASVPYQVHKSFARAPVATGGSGAASMVEGQMPLPEGLLGKANKRKIKGKETGIGRTVLDLFRFKPDEDYGTSIDGKKYDDIGARVQADVKASNRRANNIQKKLGDDYVNIFNEAEENYQQTQLNMYYYTNNTEVGRIQEPLEAKIKAGGEVLIPLSGFKKKKIGAKTKWENIIGKLSDKEIKEFNTNLQLAGKDNNLSANGNIWVTTIGGKPFTFISTPNQDTQGSLGYQMNAQMYREDIRRQLETDPIEIPGRGGMTVYKDFTIDNGNYKDTWFHFTDPNGNTETISAESFYGNKQQ
jgi:hypothetical protein